MRGVSSGFKEVYTVGQNAYGELAHGDTIERHVFTLVEACTQFNVTQVAAGNEHTLILTESGDLYSSGYNEIASAGSTSAPGSQNAVTAAVGGNSSSQMNNNTGVSPIMSGASSVMQGSGVGMQVVKTGHLKLIEKLRGKNVVKIFAANGCEHVVALTNNGKVYSFGFNVKGQLGHGDQHSLNIPKQIDALQRKFVTTVGCSYYHSIFSCSDEQETYACGRNDYGQLGLGHQEDRSVPSIIVSMNGKKIVSIGCGQYHTLLASMEGELFSCGRNDSGQLGLPPQNQQQQPESSVSVPREINGIKSNQVACGYYHSVAIALGSGQLYSWGKNDSGQLGIGSLSQREVTPMHVQDLKELEVVQVACGCYHTLALTYSGTLYAFGRNSHGQLGDGTTNSQCKPVVIQGLLTDKKVCQIAAGFYHSIVLANPVIRNPLVEDFRSLGQMRKC